MVWETLPNWFWTIHHSLWLLTLCAGIFGLFQKRIRIESIILVIWLPTALLAEFSIAIGRGDGMNEFEWLFQEMMRGSFGAMYVLGHYVYIVFWWFLFFFKKNKKYI
jgi:hypothetical protein